MSSSIHKESSSFNGEFFSKTHLGSEWQGFSVCTYSGKLKHCCSFKDSCVDVCSSYLSLPAFFILWKELLGLLVFVVLSLKDKSFCYLLFHPLFFHLLSFVSYFFLGREWCANAFWRSFWIQVILIHLSTLIYLLSRLISWPIFLSKGSQCKQVAKFACAWTFKTYLLGLN